MSFMTFPQLKLGREIANVWNQLLLITSSKLHYYSLQIALESLRESTPVYLELTLIGRSTFVEQRPMKSLSSICPSVRPSFRLWLNFPKIGSLDFSEIVCDDSLPLYLVPEKAIFLKRKILASKFEFNVPKLGPKWSSSPFSWIWIIIFSWNCVQ